MATFSQKVNLLQGLFTGDVAMTGPFYVNVDVTRRCNLRCPDCQYHSPFSNRSQLDNDTIKDIPIDLFENLCGKLKTMGTHSLILTGEGEPFLHSRILDLVSVAKSAGFHVTLFTNGTLLGEAIIESFVDSRLDTIKVSLWASSTDVYAKNYPGANADNFGRIVFGLKLIASIKTEKKSKFPSVVLHHPINRQNFKKIHAMVDLAYTTGCKTLSFSPLWSLRDRQDASALTQDEEKSLRYYLTRMKKQLDSLSINHNIDDVLLRYKIGEDVWQNFPCYIAWFHARIRTNGMVFPCHRCYLPMGNLREKRFHEIWNGSAFRTFRRHVLTRKGLTSISKHSDCRFCYFVVDNMRVHRLFRWLSPFVRSGIRNT